MQKMSFNRQIADKNSRCMTILSRMYGVDLKMIKKNFTFLLENY